MIRVMLDTTDPAAAQGIFRDLWVEIPNYTNANAPAKIQKCFLPAGSVTRDGKDFPTFLIPYAWAIEKKWCAPPPPPPPPPLSPLPSSSSHAFKFTADKYVFRGKLDPNRHQDRAARQVYEAFSIRHSALLCMPCGYGKTITTLSIFAGLGGKAKMLVFCHKNFLLSQWQARAKTFLSVVSTPTNTRALHIGRYQGKQADCDWNSFDVICASLATVSRRLAENNATAARLMHGPAEKGSTFLIVYDEAHHVPATTWLRTFFCLQNKPSLRILGLSATPRRTDGLEVFLKCCFGSPFLFPVPPPQRNKAVHLLRPGTEDAGPPPARVCIVHHPFGPQRMPISRRTGRPDFNSFLQFIVKCEERTNLIVAETMKQIQDPLTTSILILSHRVAHIRDITNRLPPGIARALYGSQKRSEKLKGHQFKEKVIASTYSYLSEGFDCKKFNVLILATPKKDVEQSIGRIAREREAKWRLARSMFQTKFHFFSQKAPAILASLLVNTKSLVIDITQGTYALRQRRMTYVNRGLCIREHSR